jgi:hypothetical protein
MNLGTGGFAKHIEARDLALSYPITSSLPWFAMNDGTEGDGVHRFTTKSTSSETGLDTVW